MEIFDGNRFNQCDPASFVADLKKLEYAGEVPFNGKSKAILGALSKNLLRSPQAKKAPELTVLGFWLRPSRVEVLEEVFQSHLTEQNVASPRGLAFHLPPQNVDTLFVYSWALSFLAGNANVVRLPSQMPVLLSWLLEIVFETLAEFDAKTTQIFCRYDHSSNLNADISALADLRMIWGGDAKVLSVSKDPVRPDGLSIGFPDRKSFSLLSADVYLQLDNEGRDKLADRLYNDIYWFDQMGCGSPRVLFWLGASESAGPDLYHRLDQLALRKSYEVEAGISLNKFTYMNQLIASNVSKSGTRFSDRLSVLKADFNPALLNSVQGGGMLLEVCLSKPEEIAAYVDRQTQTITHFGIDDIVLKNVARAMVGRGGYRIVPIGEALAFSETWDGLNLLSHMTRQITIKQ